jgi:hypothetical protein
MNLNPVTTRQYRILRGLHKVLLSSRDIFTCHRFRRFEWKGWNIQTRQRQRTAQSHGKATFGELASQDRVRVTTLVP